MAYSLGNVKAWVSDAAQELGPKFGIKTIGGWRAGSTTANSDHPKGLALDLMTTSGQGLADYARANAQRLGISYVIWNRKIWSVKRDKEGWRPYSGDSPHTDHVHVSFGASAPTGGGAVIDRGGVPGGGVVDGLAGAVGQAADALKTMAGGVSAVGDLAQKAQWLTLPSSMARIVTGGLGVLFIAVGLRFLIREVH